jgi:hypothetical protein
MVIKSDVARDTIAYVANRNREVDRFTRVQTTIAIGIVDDTGLIGRYER